MRTLLWIVAAFLLGGCSRWQVGPFLPAHPHACSADPDCADGEHCGFPSAGSRAICLPGDGDVYGWDPASPGE